MSRTRRGDQLDGQRNIVNTVTVGGGALKNALQRPQTCVGVVDWFISLSFLIALYSLLSIDLSLSLVGAAKTASVPLASLVVFMGDYQRALSQTGQASRSHPSP